MRQAKPKRTLKVASTYVSAKFRPVVGRYNVSAWKHPPEQDCRKEWQETKGTGSAGHRQSYAGPQRTISGGLKGHRLSNHLYLLVARDAAENPHYIGIYKSRIGQNRAKEDIRAYQRTHRMGLGPILGYEFKAVKCSPSTIKEHVPKRVYRHREQPADAKFVQVYPGMRVKFKPEKDLERIMEALPPSYAQAVNRFLIEFKPVLPRSGEVYTIERLRVLCAYQLLGKREVINTEGETIVEAVIKDTNLVLPLAFFEIVEEGESATP